MKTLRAKFTSTATRRLINTVVIQLLATLLTLVLAGDAARAIVGTVLAIAGMYIVVALLLVVSGSPLMHGKGKGK